MPGPLSGIRVLEVANWVAIPSAGALMADMGADVVKVEPRSGDAMRDRLRKPSHGDMRDEDFAFQSDNRGKRSIAVSLDDPAGQTVIHRLVPAFDVFTTNLLPERAQRYRLDPPSVRELHPQIVYASLTAYGHRGDDKDAIGFDTTAFFARGGTSDLLGEPDGPPARPRPGQGDHPTGLNVLVGILAALRLRDQTGEGQIVEASLLQTSAWTLACDLSVALVDRAPVPRVGRDDIPNPLNKTWRCADGRWIFVYEQVPRGKWAPFCEAVGHPEWAGDPRFATFRDRAAHLDALNPLLEALFATRPLEEWGKRFDAAGIVWHPIGQLHELVADSNLRANDAFVKVEHPRFGTFEMLNTPFRIEGADIAVRGAAPDPGAHTRAVLAESGLAADEIDALVADGVIGPDTR